MSDCWPKESLHQVHLCKLCVGRKCSWCTVRCYITVAPGVFRYHLRQHHHVGQSHPSYLRIVPKACVEVSQKNRGFISFNFRRASLIFFHKFRVQGTWAWVVYLQTPKTSRKCRLASSINSFSFPVSEVMFQFPIISLWKDCPVRVVFKTPRVEELSTVAIRQPRCIAGATWGLHLWIADGGDDRAPLTKARTRSFVTRATADARWFWLILRICWY